MYIGLSSKNLENSTFPPKWLPFHAQMARAASSLRTFAAGLGSGGVNELSSLRGSERYAACDDEVSARDCHNQCAYWFRKGVRGGI